MENYIVMFQELCNRIRNKILGAVAILVIGLWVAKLYNKFFNKALTKKRS